MPVTSGDDIMIMKRRRMVIVGHGMVGHKLIQALVRRGATRTWDIVVIGEESQGGYDRVHLSTLFDGASVDDLALESFDIAADPAVTVVANATACRIDRATQVIHAD